MKSESEFYSRYFTYVKPIVQLPIVKTYGSQIFTLLVMTIFIFYAIKPTVETILVLQKKLEDSDRILKQITQKTSNLAKAQQNYENLDPAIKSKIEAAIPSTVGLKSVIQTLEQAAQRYEASISALQLQPLVLETAAEQKAGSLSEIGFTFNIEGDYQKLLSLLQDLKGSDRLISIDNLSFSKVGEGTVLIMSLTGKAYYLK